MVKRPPNDAANRPVAGIEHGDPALIIPHLRGEARRSGVRAPGVEITLYADGGAKLTTVITDEHGIFEWRDPYAVLVYMASAKPRGVEWCICEEWPEEAFHDRSLYLPCGVFPVGHRGVSEMGIRGGQCYSCGECEMCHRTFPFRTETIEGKLYHVHYLDYWPGPPEWISKFPD